MNAKVEIPALPIPSFASAFMAPEEVGSPKSILLYGKPGTFKSSMAGGAIKIPQFKKMLYIDIDNGSEVLLNDPDTALAVFDGRIQIIQIDKLDPNAFLRVNAIIDEVTKTDFGYDVVVLDTLNVAQEVAVDYLLLNTFNENGKPDSRKAWGEVSKWTLAKMWAMHNSKFFTAIVITHMTQLTEDDGQFMLLPKLSGSAKDSIAAIPSIVAYLEFNEHPETKEPHLVATLGQSPIAVTKNRFKLPSAVVDFDIVTLFRLIEESRSGAQQNVVVKAEIPAAVAA